MNRSQRRDHRFRRGAFADRPMSKVEQVNAVVLAGMPKVGSIAGTRSGEDDRIVYNPHYDLAQFQFGHSNALPIRYATQADYPNNPVPPYIWKSCLKE